VRATAYVMVRWMKFLSTSESQKLSVTFLHIDLRENPEYESLLMLLKYCLEVCLAEDSMLVLVGGFGEHCLTHEMGF